MLFVIFNFRKEQINTLESVISFQRSYFFKTINFKNPYVVEFWWIQISANAKFYIFGPYIIWHSQAF